MPKKKFEDTPYDPIAADLAREVGAAGRTAPRPLAPLLTPMAAPTPLTNVMSLSPVPPTSVPQAHPAESTITKRFVLTRGENEEVNAFLLRLEQRAKTKVTLSVFMRAALTVAMQAEEQIVAELELLSVEEQIWLVERLTDRILIQMDQPKMAIVKERELERLLESFQTDELSLETIDAEVENVRAELYTRQKVL